MPRQANYVAQVLKEMQKTKVRLTNEIKQLEEQISSKKTNLESKVEQFKTLEHLLKQFEGLKTVKVGEKTAVVAKRKSDNKKAAVVKAQSFKIGKREAKKFKQKTIIASIMALLKNQPLHYKDIVYALRQMGFPMNGKQPEATMVALLSRDPRFERVGRGVYGLKEVQEVQDEKSA